VWNRILGTKISIIGTKISIIASSLHILYKHGVVYYILKYHLKTGGGWYFLLRHWM